MYVYIKTGVMFVCIYLAGCRQFGTKDNLSALLSDTMLMYERAVIDCSNNNLKPAVIDFKNIIKKHDDFRKSITSEQYIYFGRPIFVGDYVMSKARLVVTLSRLGKTKEANLLLEDALESVKVYMESGNLKAQPPTNLQELTQYVDMLNCMDLYPNCPCPDCKHIRDLEKSSFEKIRGRH